MKTYLVTGAAGFIGSTLTENLLKNNKVIAIDNFNDYYDPKIKKENIKNFKNHNNFKLYIGDIRDTKLIKKIFFENDIDIVIHLAAMAGVRNSIENPILYQDVNVIGTTVLLEEMKNNNVKKLIMASSSSVYGNIKELPFKEEMDVNYPISPYAASKRANEIMAYTYHKLYDIDIIALRFFTVYGPKQRPDLAINKFTRLILNNEEIPMYGDGTTLRDYTYIDDIIDGIIKSTIYLENNKNVYEIFNLGSSNPISLKEMIDIIGKTLNIKPKIKKIGMQMGDVNNTYAGISKAKKMLNYKPKTSFENGVEEFIKWYKMNNYK